MIQTWTCPEAVCKGCTFLGIDANENDESYAFCEHGFMHGIGKELYTEIMNHIDRQGACALRQEGA